MTRIGQVLAGRYRLEDLIGRGGMAEVREAQDEVLDRAVAVKMLLPRFAQDEGFIERFRREAQASASLSHPNIVAVYDTGEQDGLPFIVMELVRGRSLAEVITAGGLTERRALEVTAEVCRALSYAHSRGLVHRDIKPGNILLGEDGQVKVTDFGIARAVNAETVTQTAAVLGTAAYLSPEQAQGHPVDGRSDVYSLGVVLYEMLGGRAPFAGDTAVSVAYMHVQEMPTALRDLDPSISTAAEAIVFRAMSKNAANRYQTPEDMAADIELALGGQQVAAPAVLRAEETAILDAAVTRPAARPPEADQRRRRLGYVLLAIISVLAAAGAVYFLATLLAEEPVEMVSVPDVQSRTFPEAEELLAARGLTARWAGDVNSDTVEPGRVVSQDPGPGESVEAGAIVRLTMSTGVATVTVPRVVGIREDDAQHALREAGLVPVKDGTEFSDEVPEGIVLSSTPGEGESVPQGSRVGYVVSGGQELVRVPPVIGDTEADAQFQLEEREFRVLVVREFSDEVEEGRVISQEPQPGEELPKGSEVTIVVSRGSQAPPSPTEQPSPPQPTDEPSPEPTATEPAPTPTIIS
ncbi:MAG: Stk1 family PASTA domain-containing Ser/Thr kinase [Actinobacteria bacterium]|nr:Stk1 family PASTA domain-containing Ser/Thr kinase [Actinomycetota bacterium]